MKSPRIWASSGQTIYNWRNQDLVDRGERSGATSSDLAELVAAKRRIAELETELAATKRANEMLKQVVLPKRPLRGNRPNGRRRFHRFRPNSSRRHT